jgi:hypothetical protein
MMAAMNSDLAAFLAARLNEDEGGANWYAERMANTLEPVLTWRNVPLDVRMLREVAAKRAIIDVHSPGYPVTFPEPSGQPTCGVCHAGTWDWDPEGWPCATVRAIAAVYSDHPDYRAEWKP